MIAITLPAPQTPPLPNFDITAVLDGVGYTLSFEWNADESSWYIRVLDEPGQTVLMGDWRVVADWPLYRTFPNRTPPGYLYFADTSGQGIDPGLADLGDRVLPYYATAAELAALGIDA